MDISTGIFWLILTVFLEARNQPAVGQKDVTKLILNRAKTKNWPVSNIVFARKQFSCYNDGLLNAFSKVVPEIKYIPVVTSNVNEGIEEWNKGDDLKGATHYFNPDEVPGRWPSTWDKSKMVVLFKEGNHIFLKEI